MFILNQKGMKILNWTFVFLHSLRLFRYVESTHTLIFDTMRQIYAQTMRSLLMLCIELTFAPSARL